jgi:hypothetical protein
LVLGETVSQDTPALVVGSPVFGVEEPGVWKVYPNPFSEKLRIEAPGSHEIRISDLLGRINQVTKMENQIELETHSLKMGLYLLQCIDIKTGSVKSHVLLKEN